MIITDQLLQEVQQVYEQGNFHEMWAMLTNFCQDDLRFYIRAMGSDSVTTSHTAQHTLSQITAAILQRFAPFDSLSGGTFLSVHFHRWGNQ